MTFWETVYSWRPWRTTALLHRLLMELRRLREIIEMQYTDILTLLTDIDAATNVVAGKLDSYAVTIAELQAQIAQGVPVTQEQLDALGLALQEDKDTLLALGADPANPIP